MPFVGEHGRGGVTRRKDGRLQVSITMPSGTRVYRTVPKMTDPKRQRRLAAEALRALIAAREADLDPAGQTLADFLRSWLASMANATNARIRPNTLAFYRIMAERHVIPTLGAYPLERLSERHVQGWLDGLAMSPQYVSHCRAFLRRVLNVALRQRIIARNPAIAVELPPIPRYRAKVLSAEEAKKLLATTATDRLAAFWRLAIITGLRVGELTGLGWSDIDLEQGIVSVRSRLARQDGQWVRMPTKVERELEEIAIDPATVRTLELHRTQQAADRTADWPFWGLVFTSPTGYPIDRHRMVEALHEACDRAGIPQRRTHDLRHSNATLLRDLGVDKETRKARLGHSSDLMAERYARPSSRQDRIAVERLAEMLAER